MSTAEIEKELTTIRKQNERIERKLSLIMTEKKAIQWVKAHVVTKLTIWDREALRRARERKYVVFEKRVDGFWYSLNSIADHFFINKP